MHRDNRLIRISLLGMRRTSFFEPSTRVLTALSSSYWSSCRVMLGMRRQSVFEPSTRVIAISSSYFRMMSSNIILNIDRSAMRYHSYRDSIWISRYASSRHETKFEQSRRTLVSMSKDDQDKQKSDSIETADQAFADYLTGKTKDADTFSQHSMGLTVEQLKLVNDHTIIPSELTADRSEPSSPSSTSSSTTANQTSKGIPTSNSSPPSSEEWYNTLPKYQTDVGRPTITDLSETYRRIESTQQRNLQQSRARRVDTVHRALLGNVVITVFKFGAFLSSGSSAMLSECIHSIVDCGNQSLLLIGLRHSSRPTDRYHPYGYGKSIYFWALISALGTFFLGAGVSMTQAIPNLFHGGSIDEITWHVWAVLCLSFMVDGYVFMKTINEIREGGEHDKTDPSKSLWKRISDVRDPATLAILLEDGAACTGIVIAIAGIALTHATGMPVFDALAGVAISSLLAAMGIILVRVNHRFLLGQAVDPEIIKGIEKILLSSRSIDHVYSVQSQWTGPETFSYKAEVDFDGTYLAAKLMPRYQQEFVEAHATLDQDLRVLLSWYAEDVMRTVEREVKYIEAEIRKQYPGAQYIELEPMSKDADRFAIDDGMEAQIKRIEIENLNRYLRSLVSNFGGVT